MVEAGFELTEQNYRYLFENASDAIWVHDMKGNILDANSVCEKLTGFTRREYLAKNVKDFLTGESLDLAREVQRKLLNGEEISQPYEQRLVRKDGTVRTMKMATSLVIVNGEPRGFQHIARDVTEEEQLQENRRFYVQLITRAQEDERKRIARELHDEVASHMLLIAQRLDKITSRTGHKLPRSLKNELEQVRSEALEALGSLRRSAQDLRPRILDDLGLIPALEWMAEDMERNYGIEAHVQVAGSERAFSDDAQLLLFRIAQEALSNIRRHAEASTVVIKLEFGDKDMRMTVSDNGKGFEVPQRIEDLASAGRLGIVGMYERARLLPGTLEIRSESGKGTQVITESLL